MANDVKWFKLMNNMFEDEKIEYIESLPDGETVLLIWIKTLCLASKCNENGNLMITREFHIQRHCWHISLRSQLRKLSMRSKLWKAWV